MHMDTFVFLTNFGFVSISIGGISSHGLYLSTTLTMRITMSLSLIHICIVGQKAKLDLHVKVAKGWQSDPKQLERLGF